MLENYFLHPRYLHANDVIRIDAQEYAQDRFYTSGGPTNPVIYFTVKSLRLSHNGHRNNVCSCYVVRGVSALIQETEVHGYIPRRHVHRCTHEAFHREKLPITEYPSVLLETTKHLELCIAPFLKKGKSRALGYRHSVCLLQIHADVRLLILHLSIADCQLHVKPMFLLKGPRGCGKHELVEIASERLGLNFLDVDFAEVQALTTAPTEAKLRIVLQTAQRRVPCTLYLNNIQVSWTNDVTFGQPAL